jgi:hypothetical protein
VNAIDEIDARMAEWDRAHAPATRYPNGHFMSAVARAVSIRAGGNASDPFPAHAWPGGYPITYLSEKGYQYCPTCAAQEASNEPIVTCEIAWEGPDDHCDGCGAVLETAYGDPDAPEAVAP